MGGLLRRLACCRASVAVILLLACSGLAGAQTASPAADSSPPDILAIGDIHGDFDHFEAILQRSGVIDAQHHWSGGKTTLVQVGDELDRGPKPREVTDLLMSLQKEAAKSGGRVVPLLGNHEVMNIMGDLRYVTPENYASYADSRSEKRQHAAFNQYAKWRKAHADLLAEIPQAFREQNEEEWKAKHPAGFIEQREAFGPEGKYGKWLRERPAVVKIDGIIFLHGGIAPVLIPMKLDEMNRRVHEEIATFDNDKQFLLSQNLILPFFNLDEIAAVVQAELAARLKSPGSRHPTAGGQTNIPEHVQREILQSFLDYGHWLSVATDGPLWFRGYDLWNDQEGSENAERLLQAYGATHIVVGHTPQKDGQIRSRFGGKIFLIDTGMLSSYYPFGKASALEIFGDTKFTAEYMDQKVTLPGGTSAEGVKGSRSGTPVPANQSGATAQPH